VRIAVAYHAKFHVVYIYEIGEELCYVNFLRLAEDILKLTNYSGEWL